MRLQESGAFEFGDPGLELRVPGCGLRDRKLGFRG